MAETRRRRAATPKQEIASPEEYSAFIQQVELRTIWLAAARIENHLGPVGPERAEVAVDRAPRWETRAGGFCAFDQYDVEIFPSRGAQPAARISVTFGLEYQSVDPMTDALFRPFGEINLPLNSWPYAREFVATSIGRMNWVPLTLPALKRQAHQVRSARTNAGVAAERSAPVSRTPTRKTASPRGAVGGKSSDKPGTSE